MVNDNVLSELIYEYYESRILFGMYQYGDQLRSISQICASFGLARNTVQAALDKLEAAGYIKTEQRKMARIVYQGTEETFRENAMKYFVPRRDGMLDINRQGALLFSTVWETGLKNFERNISAGLYKKTNSTGILGEEPTKLYYDVLRTFNNNLMDSLYWQFLRYLNYFYPNKEYGMANYMEDGLLSVEKANRMKAETDAYYYQNFLEVLAFVNSISEEHHLKDVQQIPFTWTMYRKRPQVRYTLASTIIREIFWEVYPVGSYLPSLPKMAERYHVSLSTVRRTLDVLHSLGVTKTYMGVGTRVCMEPINPDILDTREMQENMTLHKEGMELLSLTVYNVTLFTLESITAEKREALRQEIGRLRGKNNNILCIDVLLKFISTEVPSAFLRECYGKLRELMAWGYIFSAVLSGSGEQPDTDLNNFITQLETDMMADNWTACAGSWQAFIEDRLDFLRSRFPLGNRQDER